MARTLALKEGLSNQVVYEILSTVLPKDKAMVIAGFSLKKKSVSQPERCPLTTAEIRKRIESVAGVTYADQIAWYFKKSEDPNVPTGEQIQARKQIDKLQGYESAQKVEINERREIVGAIGIFSDFANQAGLSPKDLKIALANRAREIPSQIVDGTNG